MMARAGNSHLLTVLSYPNAGHLIKPPYTPHARSSTFKTIEIEEKSRFTFTLQGCRLSQLFFEDQRGPHFGRFEKWMLFKVDVQVILWQENDCEKNSGLHMQIISKFLAVPVLVTAVFWGVLMSVLFLQWCVCGVDKRWNILELRRMPGKRWWFFSERICMVAETLPHFLTCSQDDDMSSKVNPRWKYLAKDIVRWDDNGSSSVAISI